jgi:hypothetical protein
METLFLWLARLMFLGIFLMAGVVMTGLEFTVWTGLSALVLWSYYFMLRIVVARAEHTSES